MKLAIALALTAIVAGLAPVAAAQTVSAADREALARIADEAAAKGLPSAPLTNKIQEGIAKGYDVRRIEQVVRQKAVQLETSDQLLRELDGPATGPERDGALTLLAESLERGVTPNDVRELRRQSQIAGKAPLTGEIVASAAYGLSFISDTRLSVDEGRSVVAEAVRQGFRAHELIGVGREIKRRERDFIAGRSTLRAVRDAIARGDRPEELFRDSRPETLERPPRPAAPERPARPERPAQPERPVRPERPERPERPVTRQ